MVNEDSIARRQCLEALALKLAQARLPEKIELLDAMADEEIVLRLVGKRFLNPFAGEYRGREATRAALQSVAIEFEYRETTVQHVMIDGDHVGLRWSGVLRNRGTSAQARFECFTHIVFKGDKIAEYVAFMDTAAIARLAEWPC